jgi:hypothetical protein
MCAGKLHADTWLPPHVETTVSSDGVARVTITPRPLSGALHFFEDKVAGKEPAGQQQGSTQTHPMALMERKVDGRWQKSWEGALVNDVAPVSALVAGGGRYLATFDNWHSTGYGSDVVVIYDGKGALIRKLALKDFLPAKYIVFLPRSVSSLWWGRDHAFDDNDETLVLRVIVPSESRDEGQPTKTIPMRIRMKDGYVYPPTGKDWEEAEEVIARLDAKRMARWQEARELRARPLVVPTGTDDDAWQAYAVELRERLSQGTGHDCAGSALSEDELDGRNQSPLNTFSFLLDGYADRDMRMADCFVFVAPDSRSLAKALVRHLSSMSPGSLRGATIAVLGEPAEAQEVRNAAARLGAGVLLVDKAVPYPAGKLPENPPEWFN